MKQQPQAEYVPVDCVATRMSVHKATIWQWVSEGRFPKPVKFAPRCTRWKMSEILAWEAEQGVAN